MRSVPAQDDPRFTWSYDRKECYDLSPGGQSWKLHESKSNTGRILYTYRAQDYYRTGTCTRLYTARRALMRLIATLDENNRRTK